MPASRLTAAEIGLTGPLGQRATLLQLSSGFCAPCRATRGLLERVAETTAGVRHVDLDVTHHPELAAPPAIPQPPTMPLLDAADAELAPHQGLPRIAGARELPDR